MPYPTPQKKKHKHERWEAYYQLSLLGMFVGLIVGGIYFWDTLISFLALSKIFALCAFIGLLIPLKYYRKWFSFNIYGMFIFNFCGVGPLLTALFLVLNFYFSSVPYNQIFQVDRLKVYANTVLGSNNQIILSFEEPKLNNYRRMRTFEGDDFVTAAKAKKVQYTFAKGLFGFEVEKGYKLLIY